MNHPTGVIPLGGGALPRTAYSVAEVAQSLGVTEKHVRGLCHSGALRSIFVGRYLRIPTSALEEFLRTGSSAA